MWRGAGDWTLPQHTLVISEMDVKPPSSSSSETSYMNRKVRNKCKNGLIIMASKREGGKTHTQPGSSAMDKTPRLS